MKNPPIRKGAELKAAVNKIVRLQALPKSVQNILSVLNTKSSTAEDVAREIGKDLTFSSQVLKLINSGFYGFSVPVKSIPHATVLLGFNAIKTLVTATSMVPMFADSFDGLWKHSLACATTCSTLARLLGGKEPEEISVLGLLHDMGKVVLQQYLPNEFHAVMDTVKRDDRLMLEAESMVLEVTHADIGSWVLKKWNLPEEVVVPIAEHHSLNAEGALQQRAAILNLADILVRAIGCGSGGDTRIPGMNHEVASLLSIEPKDMRGIMKVLFVELAEFM